MAPVALGRQEAEPQDLAEELGGPAESEGQEAELERQAQDLEAKAPRAASSNQPAPMVEQAGFLVFRGWVFLT